MTNLFDHIQNKICTSLITREHFYEFSLKLAYLLLRKTADKNDKD